MVKLEEIRNETDERACDLLRDENGALCYQMKCRDNRGKVKNVNIKFNDMVYPAIKHMTLSERQRLMMFDSYKTI